MQPLVQLKSGPNLVAHSRTARGLALGAPGQVGAGLTGGAHGTDHGFAESPATRQLELLHCCNGQGCVGW